MSPKFPVDFQKEENTADSLIQPPGSYVHRQEESLGVSVDRRSFGRLTRPKRPKWTPESGLPIPKRIILGNQPSSIEIRDKIGISQQESNNGGAVTSEVEYTTQKRVPRDGLPMLDGQAKQSARVNVAGSAKYTPLHPAAATAEANLKTPRRNSTRNNASHDSFHLSHDELDLPAFSSSTPQQDNYRSVAGLPERISEVSKEREPTFNFDSETPQSTFIARAATRRLPPSSGRAPRARSAPKLVLFRLPSSTPIHPSPTTKPATKKSTSSRKDTPFQDSTSPQVSPNMDLSDSSLSDSGSVSDPFEAKEEAQIEDAESASENAQSEAGAATSAGIRVKYAGKKLKNVERPRIKAVKAPRGHNTLKLLNSESETRKHADYIDSLSHRPIPGTKSGEFLTEYVGKGPATASRFQFGPPSEKARDRHPTLNRLLDREEADGVTGGTSMARFAAVYYDDIPRDRKIPTAGKIFDEEYESETENGRLVSESKKSAEPVRKTSRNSVSDSTAAPEAEGRTGRSSRANPKDTVSESRMGGTDTSAEDSQNLEVGKGARSQPIRLGTQVAFESGSIQPSNTDLRRAATVRAAATASFSSRPSIDQQWPNSSVRDDPPSSMQSAGSPVSREPQLQDHTMAKGKNTYISIRDYLARENQRAGSGQSSTSATPAAEETNTSPVVGKNNKQNRRKRERAKLRRANETDSPSSSQRPSQVAPESSVRTATERIARRLRRRPDTNGVNLEMFAREPVFGTNNRQEENFLAKPSIKLNIPDHINALLVDDWENVTKNLQLVPIPARKPVTLIIEEYLQHARANKDAATCEILEETMAGMRAYFDKCLGRVLLYKFERNQYGEVYKEWQSNDGRALNGKTASDTYGAEHLIRLLVTLPELIAQTNMDQQSVNRLRLELTAFTTWLSHHINDYFVSEYETPSTEYIESARSQY